MTLDLTQASASPHIEGGTELAHVQRLADLHAIQQLGAAYPILVDSQDLDGVLSLFTEDATFLRAGSSHTGRHELQQFFAQILEHYSMTVHTVHQHVVDLALGARTAVGVQMGHGEVAVDRRRMLASYRYDDEYRWEDGRWLFAQRRLRYHYFSSHDDLGRSLSGRQRIRIPGSAPRDAEIPEELESYQAARASVGEHSS